MKPEIKDFMELKEICQNIYGRSFSDDEIEEMGMRLINEYKLILNINRNDY